MLPILIACVVWLPALIGLGSPLANALRRSSGAIVCSVALRTAIAGLMGIFVASTFTAAANFVLPVYPWVSIAQLLAGWFLLIWRGRGWLRLPRPAWHLCLAILLVVALIDARGIPWYDTGLYHLQAVQWMTTGPLPRGLANLNYSLGFNCSWFCFAAAVETPLVLGKSCFIVNALLAILIALTAVDALLRTSRSGIRADRVLFALMLIPLGIFGIGVAMISSLAPDLIIMLLVIFSIALWLRSKSSGPYILCFACFAMTIKLSAAPLLVMAAIMTVAGKYRWGLIPAGFCMLAAVISAFRGIWLSGYPAFPSSFGRISGLSWASPPALADHAARTVACWSKYHSLPESVVPGSPWVGAWCHAIAMSQPMLIAYCLCITGIVLCIWRRPPTCSGIHRRGILALLLLPPAVAFWFFSAPQVRFGYGYIFSLAAVPVALGLGGYVLPSLEKRHRQAIVAIGMLLLVLWFRIDRQILKTPLLHWPKIPVAKKMEAHPIKDVITIWTPRGDDRAWNAPLPTTPRFDPQLRCDVDPAGRVVQFRIQSP
jgi:hypothetical protein